MNTRNSNFSSVDFSRMSLRKCPRSSFISRFGGSETTLGQPMRSSISCSVYRRGEIAISESSSKGVVAVQAGPLGFCPRQILHLFVEQLRVPADVEGPPPQLAPVVHRFNPPVRRGVLGLRLVVFEALDLQHHGHAVIQAHQEIWFIGMVDPRVLVRDG